MSTALRLTFVAVLLFWGAPSLPAQDDPCTTRTVPVTVVDKQGNLVAGLTVANFRGNFRGKPVEILSVTPDTRPRRIVIVLDASGSMMGPEPGSWGLVPAIAAQLFRVAPSYSRFALIVFSSTIQQKVGFDQEPLALTRALAILPDKALRGVKVEGKTALLDALAAALSELNPPHPGDAIFAITDGGDNRSKIERGDLEHALVAKGVRVFVCMPLPALRARTPEEASGPQNMISLARATGGSSYSSISSSAGPWSSTVYAQYGEQINRALAAFAQQIGRYDRVEARLAEPVDKPRDWKLEVLGENGKPKRDLAILYPHKLVPCGAAQKNN